jgi:hypothetical protein
LSHRDAVQYGRTDFVLIVEDVVWKQFVSHLVEAKRDLQRAWTILDGTDGAAEPTEEAVTQALDAIDAVFKTELEHDWKSGRRCAGRRPGLLGSHRQAAWVRNRHVASRRWTGLRLTVGGRSDLVRVVFRILGRDLFRYLEATGLMAKTVTSRIGERMKDRETLMGSSPRGARKQGITMRARATAADGATVTFADGSHLAVDAVVWATGFRLDHSLVELPVVNASGRVEHQRGVTRVPGLYFLGLPCSTPAAPRCLGGSRTTPTTSRNGLTPSLRRPSLPEPDDRHGSTGTAAARSAMARRQSAVQVERN